MSHLPADSRSRVTLPQLHGWVRNRWLDLKNATNVACSLLS